MSSHREAPEISKDPVADSTDIYAFVSPDRPDTVTIITNYIPLEDPAGGPNFFEFGDDVLYRINVDNDGDGRADITYEFTFKTDRQQPGHVPLQHRARSTRSTAPTSTAGSPTPSPRIATGKQAETLGKNLASPPCNVGLRSTPNYAALANSAIYDARRRHQGVRRAAARRVLRRPRIGVRPGRAAPVPEPAPDPDRRRRRASTPCAASTCTRSRSRSRSAG